MLLMLPSCAGMLRDLLGFDSPLSAFFTARADAPDVRRADSEAIVFLRARGCPEVRMAAEPQPLSPPPLHRGDVPAM